MVRNWSGHLFSRHQPGMVECLDATRDGSTRARWQPWAPLIRIETMLQWSELWLSQVFHHVEKQIFETWDVEGVFLLLKVGIEYFFHTVLSGAFIQKDNRWWWNLDEYGGRCMSSISRLLVLKVWSQTIWQKLKACLMTSMFEFNSKQFNLYSLHQVALLDSII